MRSFHKSKQVNTIPFIGISLFVLLYYIASTMYPGGSQADLNSAGFDWVNNYWCNLMNEHGMNDEINPARPWAIAAMIILCTSLAVFFVQFAHTFSRRIVWRNIISYCGIVSMLLAILIFTEYHDLMTILSSVFGLFVVIGIIREVYLSKLVFYKLTGIFCILLLALNNYIYYSQMWIELLPLLQKFTFLIVLVWIIGLNTIVRKRLNI